MSHTLATVYSHRLESVSRVTTVTCCVHSCVHCSRQSILLHLSVNGQMWHLRCECGSSPAEDGLFLEKKKKKKSKSFRSCISLLQVTVLFSFFFFFLVSHSHNSWRPWFSRTVRRSWELLASQIGNCASTKTRLRQQRWLYITVELIMSCRRTKHSINISYKNEVPIVFLTWLKKPKWWTRQDKNGNTDFLCQHREHVHPSLSSSLFFFFFLSLLSLFCPLAAGYEAAGVVVMLPFEDSSLRPVWGWKKCLCAPVHCILLTLSFCQGRNGSETCI